MTLTQLECGDFRQFSDCYLDAEFDARDRAAFDAHLAACADCRAHLDNQIAFRQALRPHFQVVQREGLSFEARARIRRALADAERPSFMALWARRLALPVPAVAVAVLLLIPPTVGFAPREAVLRHTEASPVEVPSAQADEINAWFKDKVRFEVNAPRFRDPRVQLLGGRLTHVHTRAGQDETRQAAYLVYAIGRHKLSVLVFDGTGVDLPDAAEAGDAPENGGQSPARRDLVLQNQDAFNVAMFRNGGSIYTVTSDLPEPKLVALVDSAF
ncbi:zf-HC2 domain-containing protein [Myxococcota bacterium]|nr:zf-HC2 domain-containing protein [Myxococcota bacterium]